MSNKLKTFLAFNVLIAFNASAEVPLHTWFAPKPNNNFQAFQKQKAKFSENYKKAKEKIKQKYTELKQYVAKNKVKSAVVGIASLSAISYYFYAKHVNYLKQCAELAEQHAKQCAELAEHYAEMAEQYPDRINGDCCICYDSMNSATNQWLNCCSQLIHTTCLSQWQNGSPYRSYYKCPLCNAPHNK